MIYSKTTKMSKKIHKLAAGNPLMQDEAFTALKVSLSSIGQQQPILLYRGFVVDGRNRLNALTELKIDEVTCTELPNNTTLAELEKIVNATETRRHQTKTQLAIKAYNLANSTGIKQSDAATEIGVSTRLVRSVSSINKLRPDVINGLFAGEMYKTILGKYTDSLGAILHDIKSQSTTATVTDVVENAGKSLTDREQLALTMLDSMQLSDTEMANVINRVKTNK